MSKKAVVDQKIVGLILILILLFVLFVVIATTKGNLSNAWRNLVDLLRFGG